MNESYIFFTREEAGRPKMITTALATDEERRGFDYVVVARLEYRAQGNGLPVAGELDRVTRIEDRLIEALKGAGAWYLGHITYNGAMQVVFQSPRKAPQEIVYKTGLLKSERVGLDCRHDPDWAWYEAEMQPNAVEYEIGLSRQLLGVLKQHGDRHELSRLVDFGALFPSEATRASFLRAIEPAGYKVTEKGLWEAKGEFWCEVNLPTSVQIQVIAEHCAFLREQAGLAGGKFDGWATPVTSE